MPELSNTAEAKSDPETETLETPEAANARLTQQIHRTEQQRDFLGDQLRQRIGRFHALRIANGDMQPEHLMNVIGQEVGALKAAVDGMGTT